MLQCLVPPETHWGCFIFCRFIKQTSTSKPLRRATVEDTVPEP